MMCKICDRDLIGMSESFLFCSYSTNILNHLIADRGGGLHSIGHYVYAAYNDYNCETFKYNKFKIELTLDKLAGNITTVRLALINARELISSYYYIDVSPLSFKKFNFDPKNPQNILDRISKLKSFY